MYKKVISYSNMILKVTGVNRNWIIDNNTPLLDCFANTDFARNIQTYDFSTLYTNLDHSNINTALSSVIKLMFKHAKCKYISIYSKSFAWVNKPRDTTFSFDENSLIEGVDPGPYIANLTVSSD